MKDIETLIADKLQQERAARNRMLLERLMRDGKTERAFAGLCALCGLNARQDEKQQAFA